MKNILNEERSNIDLLKVVKIHDQVKGDINDCINLDNFNPNIIQSFDDDSKYLKKQQQKGRLLRKKI